MTSVIQTSNKIGMQTLDQDLMRLVNNRIITKEAARQKAANKADFI